MDSVTRKVRARDVPGLAWTVASGGGRGWPVVTALAWPICAALVGAMLALGDVWRCGVSACLCLLGAGGRYRGLGVLVLVSVVLMGFLMGVAIVLVGPLVGVPGGLVDAATILLLVLPLGCAAWRLEFWRPQSWLPFPRQMHATGRDRQSWRFVCALHGRGGGSVAAGRLCLALLRAADHEGWVLVARPATEQLRVTYRRHGVVDAGKQMLREPAPNGGTYHQGEVHEP